MQKTLPGIVSRRGRPVGGSDKEPLQVRIPAPLKRRFKAHAAMRGLEPNELFVEIWNHYEVTVLNRADNVQAS